ncbi:MAG: aldo/keto reductase family protein [Flaviflexus sp.]|nr:aldo/keto reductase family protein [Flaviflexus sp.]
MVSHVYLGNSGLKVSNIILGNWLTHGSQIEEEAAHACVNAALDAGITTFDTADVYANGVAEEVLGRALAGQKRENLEIFTKVYFPTGDKGHNDCGLSRKHIMESIDRSLKRLGTDYVDLYQAHRYDVETPIEETMQAFADVVKAGKALYIGVSEWTAEQLKFAHDFSRDMGFQVISNQPQYNMLYRVIEKEIMPMAERCGMSQIVWSPLAQGVLTGKYPPRGDAPAGSRATDKAGAQMIQKYLTDEILDAVAELKEVADDLGVTRAQLAIAWVLSHDNVASAIIGASRPEQVTENVVASDLDIPREHLRRIDEIFRDVMIDDPRLTWENAPHERPC